ncbi:MAG: metallophosphoesterase [Spirochaetia bacterium]|nr:metallophosphoesterase [Spirochaetia bacterium]
MGVRIGLISDIHVDLNRIEGEEVVTGLLARESARRKLDILLVAGDISSDYALTLKTIRALEDASGVRLLFVPGNHDIWNENYPGRKAWDSYKALLEHPGNLARGAVSLPGGWTIVGDLGWYDFAYGDSSFSQAEFQKMKHGGRTWQDKIKSIWDRPTLDMHRLFMERLESRLEESANANKFNMSHNVNYGSAAANANFIAAAANVTQTADNAASLGDGATEQKILFVTHVVQIREFTVQNPGSQWKYFNAFLGSPEYGELAQRYGAKMAVCGHVHYRRQVIKGETRFVCPCLGYVTEWPAPADPEQQIAETLQVFEFGAQDATPLSLNT